jgi:hypothetical protein
MNRHRGRSLKSLVIALLVASTLAPAGASAAVFTTAPPQTMTEDAGPITWAFASDAPGTMWGNVTWKVSTESEWHTCGGPTGAVTLEGLGPGTYWVEIADEVDLGIAGDSAGEAPFTRCTEPHSPAPGPLQPVTLVAVTVVLPPSSPTATTTVTVVEPPRCRKARARRAKPCCGRSVPGAPKCRSAACRAGRGCGPARRS